MEKELSKRLSKWRSVRDSTRKTLYRLADRLDRKLQESKESKRNMAAVNLASGVAGVLAPFTGGASLIVPVAIVGSVGAMYKNWRSDNESSQAEREAMNEVKQILKRYDEETKKIINDYQTIVSILQYEIIFELRDIIVELEYKKIETLTVERHSTQGRILCGTENTYDTMSCIISSTLDISSMLSCCITEEVAVCTEIFNAAKSLNDAFRFGRQPLQYALSGGPLALANQAKQMTGIQSLSHVAKYTTSAGAISKFASIGQKATRRVTKTVLNSDKVVRVTAKAQTTKAVRYVTKAVTENAKISQVGLAIGVIAIPLDIYSLMCTQNDLIKTPEAVKRIRRIADDLEKEDFTAMIEAFEKMHIEVCMVYEREEIEKLHEFLDICFWELGLNIY